MRTILTLVLLLPLFLFVSWLASRLLGVRRSWVNLLVAAVLGWLIGMGLSLAVHGWDVDADGVVRAGIVFSLIATMFASVGLDFLARPGSLAKGEEAGRFATPRPIRAIRAKLAPLARYREIAAIFRRHGLVNALAGQRKGDRSDEQTARELRDALEECGGMFVKLGQVASTRGDLLSAEMTAALAQLQSDVTPAAAKDVKVLLEKELGKPVDEVFAEFDWEPVAAASIAHAYRARLPSGEDVVVKVQRPGIEDLVRRDVDALRQFARIAQERTVWGGRFGILAVVDEFTEGLLEELDFRIEAASAKRIAANMARAGIEDVRVPAVHGGLSSRRVLVQQWFGGVEIGDHEALRSRHVDTERLADDLLAAVLHQMLVDGVFHADPHPGNVLVLEDGDIGLLDFGAVGVLDPVQKDALARMIFAVMERDATLLRSAVTDVTTIPEDTDITALERALGRFMSVYVTEDSSFSAEIFTDLIDLLTDFGIQLPSGLTAFSRALVTLDGTLSTLHPGYEIGVAARRVAPDLMSALTQDEGGAIDPNAPMDELIRRELIAQAPWLRPLPRQTERVMRMLERGELSTRVRLFADQKDIDTTARLVNRGVLGFLGGTFGIAGAVLLATSGGPVFGDDIALFHVFGYASLLTAAVLGLRVAAAIVRDGLN